MQDRKGKLGRKIEITPKNLDNHFQQSHRSLTIISKQSLLLNDTPNNLVGQIIFMTSTGWKLKPTPSKFSTEKKKGEKESIVISFLWR